MSTPFDPKILTRQTNADLSSSEFLLVKPNGDDDIDVISVSGHLAIGALTNDVADGSGSNTAYLPVQVGGIIKVACGDSITAGVLAMSNGDGQAVTATDGNYAFGIALESHVSGDVGAFLWAPSYLETT